MITGALMIHAGMTFNGKEQVPYVTADVQVWNGNQHIITIDMRVNETPELYTANPGDSLEQWASAMGRRVARMLEDNFAHCVESTTINYASDFEMVTQVTSDPK